MTIAVTGATGQLGRLVVQQLKTRVPTSDLVALVRTPAKATALGVAVRQADYEEPGSLLSALAGVDTLLLISSSEVGKRAAQHHNAIEAAKQAGVRWIVYTSLLHADRSTIDLAAEHRVTEAELKASGVPVTILRNGWYTENYASSLSAALANGTLLGSAGDGRISSAARADFAAAAAVVLTSKGYEGKTYELAGDEAFTLGDLAAELSRQTGRDTPYRDLPEAEYAAALAQAGLPKPLAKMIAGWDTAVAHGALFDDGRQLSALIGRPTTTLRSSVADMLAVAKA